MQRKVRRIEGRNDAEKKSKRKIRRSKDIIMLKRTHVKSIHKRMLDT